MFSFSVKEINLYVSMDEPTLDAMWLCDIGSIAFCIAESVQAFKDTSVDAHQIDILERKALCNENYLNDAKYQKMQIAAFKSGNLDALPKLTEKRERASGTIYDLNQTITALREAQYVAFRDKWAENRTTGKGKQGPRDSVVGKVLSVGVNGDTRVMPIAASNIWQVYVRIAQADGTHLDNVLPGASSSEFGELPIKYASTAKRFMCAFGHTSKTTRDGQEYACDGTIEGLHRAMADKSYGKLAFGGSVGINTVSENASEWVPSNG